MKKLRALLRRLVAPTAETEDPAETLSDERVLRG
jgi:hypothetical protein